MHSMQSAVMALLALTMVTSATPLQRRDDAPVSCAASHVTHSQAIPKGSGFGWTVFIPQNIGLQAGGECGDNFLNYLRAQSDACKTITSWACSPITPQNGGDPLGIFATFDTNIFCGTGQVQKAIWDSTSPQLQNSCSNQDPDQDPSDIAAAIIEGIGAFAGEVVRPGK